MDTTPQPRLADFRGAAHARDLVIGLLLAVTALLLPAAAAADAAKPKPTPAPQLSIAIANGHTSAAKGDKLRYTITVKNLGVTGVKKLDVTQTLPTGLRFISADHEGVESGAGVAWRLNLGPGATTTLRSVTSLAATPDDLLRLASVACAAAYSDQSPIVCATHSDQLPAGAAPAEVVPPAHASGSSTVTWVVGVTALVLLLVGLAGLVTRRRASGAHTM